jgi:hypothetical protein
MAESQLNYYRHSLTTSDQIVNKIMDEDKGAAKIRSMIVQKFEKIDDIVQDFKEIAADSLAGALKKPGEEDEDKPSTWEKDLLDTTSKDEFTTEVMDEVKVLLKKYISDQKTREYIYLDIEDDIVAKLTGNTTEEARARKDELIAYAEKEIKKSIDWKDVEMADLFEDVGEKKTKNTDYLDSKWDWVVE